ncbi:hypothetical protein GJ496_006636 [Pomphorhynchus laevis]|nr:hypothetical protein GJ496_006636 [Pomphorhynchus laevis]
MVQNNFSGNPTKSMNDQNAKLAAIPAFETPILTTGRAECAEVVSLAVLNPNPKPDLFPCTQGKKFQTTIDIANYLIMVNVPEPSGETADNRISKVIEFIYKVLTRLSDNKVPNVTVVPAVKFGRISTAGLAKPHPKTAGLKRSKDAGELELQIVDFRVVRRRLRIR